MPQYSLEPNGKKRKAVIGAMICLPLMATVGCGSTASGDANSGEKGDASACVEAAKEGVEQARTALEMDNPSEAVDASSLSGKSVWFISPTQASPYTAAQSKAIEKAAGSVDVDLKIFDGKGSPDLFNQGFSSALAEQADGVILNSIDPGLVNGPLGKARSSDVPVTDVLVGLPGETPAPGIYQYLSPDYVAMGKALADYALAKTGCDTNALVVTTSVYPFLEHVGKGLEDEYRKLCPDCELTVKSVDPTTIGTKLSPLVVNELTRNPKTNYIIAGYTGLIPYIIPAQKQMNKEIPIISTAGTDADFDEIRKGSLQVANVALAPADYVGYQQFDVMLRALAGLEAPTNAIPFQLVDETNIGSDNSELFPGTEDFEATFEKLWSGSGG